MTTQEQLEALLKDGCPEGFAFKTGTIAGDECTLVFPQHIGATWTKRNLILRSTIFRTSDFYPVSLGLKKFHNWHEKPELTHRPFSTTANGGINVMEKLDGSLLSISKYKGELITRTRGTFDASALDTGAEIGYLMQEYPDLFNVDVDSEGTCNHSLITEWTSPNNIIVLKYGDDPDIVLLNKVNHEDYTLETQRNLDDLGKKLGVRRPERYHYDKIKDMLEDVPTWDGREGVCVYSKKDQAITKIKAEIYLALHRMKSELSSFGRVLDVFIEFDMPSYTDFHSLVTEAYDFEIAQRAMPHMSICCDGWKEVKNIIVGMQNFLDNTLNTIQSKKGFRETRKQQAKAIFESYGHKSNRAGMLFTLLDGGDLGKDEIKKLMFQVIKEPIEEDA